MPDDDQERSLGDSIRNAIAAALRVGPRNVAAAINVSRPGQRVVAYSEDGITVVQRDGRTVVHHGEQETGTGADGDD